jgi:intron-binding protein aquarius
LTKEYLTELFVRQFERRRSQLEAINAMPLYPTEALLYDENVVPTASYSGDEVLVLPKLNVQYLFTTPLPS